MCWSDDPFVASSAGYLIGQYGTFADASEIVNIKQLWLGKDVIKTQAGSIPFVLNIVDLGRGQLYSKLDRMLDTTFLVYTLAFTTIFVLLYALCVRHKQWLKRHSDKGANDAQIEHNQATDEHSYEGITNEVRPLILRLEKVVRSAAEAQLPLDSSNKQIEEAVSDRMQDLAQLFLTRAQHDATSEVAFLIWSSGSNRLLALLLRAKLLGNPAAVAGVVLEVVCENMSWNENVVYVMQGVIVCCIGFDIFSTAVQAVANVSVQHRNPFTLHTGRCLFGLPILWLLLVAACFSSHQYYCDSTCHSKHYLYPVLLLVKNQSLFQTLFAFGNSLVSAAVIFFLFFCLVLCSAAVGMLMLQGALENGDHYTDNQVQSPPL